MKRFTYSERVWLQAALLLLAAIPATLVARELDVRTVNDINVWIKPLKFFASTALHLATLALLVTFLSDKARAARWLSVMAGVSAFAAIVEIAVIAAQAGRGVASHFNFTTSFDALIYTFMGAGVLVVTIPALVIGVWFLRAPVTEKLTPGLKLSAGLGLTLGFLLTLVIAGYMSAQPGGHWVGGPRTDLGGLPIVGWSREGGDLRVPHFFATHLMQALPLLGYAAEKIFKLDATTAKRAVWIAAALGVALALATFMQALNGEPFIG
ncbi:hypothetical protein [Hyphococcus luteus]|uniref:Uncharacterized protein n=1 Tax=Hyphococcus luteus TaxID=2058213 RepID=A0A2S7K643_9PROT|nr:hypothetical protein [Marinicaulis flavus]PQA87984.1 hypothetical protein CW354_06510 [Marinicaulis flavus]